MSYDSKTLIRDGSGLTPAPQYYNPIADDYEVLSGRNGAQRVELYGPDGSPITITSNKLAVRASELETILNTLGTQTTLAAVLAKLSSDPATQTTLAAILAKIIAAPATEAKQDTLNAKDFATQTTLAAILTQLGTTGLKKIIDALPAGSNVIGKVGIDQTAPGVTNAVTVSDSIPTGTNSIGKTKRDITVTKIIDNTNTVIASGGTYVSGYQVLTSGGTYAVSMHLLASKTCALYASFFNTVGSYVADVVPLLSSAARGNGSAALPYLASERLKLNVSNGAGEDITLSDLFLINY